MLADPAPAPTEVGGAALGDPTAEAPDANAQTGGKRGDGEVENEKLLNTSRGRCLNFIYVSCGSRGGRRDPCFGIQHGLHSVEWSDISWHGG